MVSYPLELAELMFDFRYARHLLDEGNVKKFKLLSALTREPLIWLIAHRDFDTIGCLPFDDGAFDQAGIGQ